MPYLGKQSEQVGVSVQKYEYLQGTDTTTGTTVFSIPSDSADHVNVWLNGVLLVEGGSDDYSKSNTAITFNSAPADGDIVRCDVIESFALPDALKSSGDTMSGALKLNGGIKQQTSADLSGTYADHQVMLSDSYSVTGDVTISDNLVLAKLSDDSNAVTLTNDTSTRTVTGTGGSLEMGTLIQTPNASLTGMTGEIGSAVTGGSGLTSLTGSCYFVLSATNTWTTLSNNGLLAFNTIEIDDDSRCNTTGSKFTAPATGIYQFGATLFLRGNTDAFYSFYINGTNISFTYDDTFGTVYKPDSEVAHSFSIPLKLNINDYVTVQAPRGGDWYGQHSFWWGYRLR